MMKRFVLPLAVSLCFSVSARADDASQHAKAKELVQILHTQRMVTQISESIKQRVNQAAERMSVANTSPESKTKLADFEKKTSEMVDSQLNWTELEPQYVDIYAKAFTEPQLDAILAFYKSPDGTAFLEKTPAVNLQINQLTQSKLEVLQGQINQAIQDFRAGQTQTPSSSPAPKSEAPESKPQGSNPTPPAGSANPPSTSK